MWTRLAAAVALCAAGLAAPTEASAKKRNDGEGVEISITVRDLQGEPIPTAVVRHPDEADRHRVNAATGEYVDDVLYLPDGSELIFTPGMTIQFEISAPGYMMQIVQYDIKKRKNRIEITLPPLPLDEDDEIEEPLIQFGRDRPREVGGGRPAN